VLKPPSYYNIQEFVLTLEMRHSLDHQNNTKIDLSCNSQMQHKQDTPPFPHATNDNEIPTTFSIQQFFLSCGLVKFHPHHKKKNQ
jgi:hypothetical protein